MQRYTIKIKSPVAFMSFALVRQWAQQNGFESKHQISWRAVDKASGRALIRPNAPLLNAILDVPMAELFGSRDQVLERTLERVLDNTQYHKDCSVCHLEITKDIVARGVTFETLNNQHELVFEQHNTTTFYLESPLGSNLNSNLESHLVSHLNLNSNSKSQLSNTNPSLEITKVLSVDGIDHQISYTASRAMQNTIISLVLIPLLIMDLRRYRCPWRFLKKTPVSKQIIDVIVSRPVPLKRSHIKDIHEIPYGVSFKADGQRGIVMSLPRLNRIIVLMPLSIHVFERTFDTSRNAKCPSVFDIEYNISLANKTRMAKYFVLLDLIGIIRPHRIITPKHRETRMGACQAFSRAHPDIVRCTYVAKPARRTCFSFAQIQDLDAHTIDYAIDGLVFAPMYEGYFSRKPIVKWKPRELLTIDLRVIWVRWENNDTRVVLTLDGPRARNMPSSVHAFKRKHRDIVILNPRIIGALKELDFGPEDIVECHYDTDINCYVPLKKRPDRVAPNTWDEIMDLVSLYDNHISLECLSNPVDEPLEVLKMSIEAMKDMHSAESKVQGMCVGVAGCLESCDPLDVPGEELVFVNKALSEESEFVYSLKGALKDKKIRCLDVPALEGRLCYLGNTLEDALGVLDVLMLGKRYMNYHETVLRIAYELLKVSGVCIILDGIRAHIRKWILGKFTIVDSSKTYTVLQKMPLERDGSIKAIPTFKNIMPVAFKGDIRIEDSFESLVDLLMYMLGVEDRDVFRSMVSIEHKHQDQDIDVLLSKAAYMFGGIEVFFWNGSRRKRTLWRGSKDKDKMLVLIQYLFRGHAYYAIVFKDGNALWRSCPKPKKS